jgi:hypothetical protein
MRAPTMATTVLRDFQSCSTLDSIDMNIDPVLLEPSMLLFTNTNPSTKHRESRYDSSDTVRTHNGARVVTTLIDLPRRMLLPNFSGCNQSFFELGYDYVPRFNREVTGALSPVYLPAFI